MYLMATPGARPRLVLFGFFVGFSAVSQSFPGRPSGRLVARSMLENIIEVARDVSVRAPPGAPQGLVRRQMNKEIFFETVAQRVGCDVRRAEGLTFAVFQELRDRLTPGEAADVDAQLPAGLKPLWEFLDRPGRHVRKIHESQFIGEVRLIASLPDQVEAERAVVAVFATLQELLGSPTGIEGEAWDVMSQLPKDLKKLWLGAHGRLAEFHRV
jgi:uncharacterized protein (DUF2267 family)